MSTPQRQAPCRRPPPHLRGVPDQEAGQALGHVGRRRQRDADGQRAAALHEAKVRGEGHKGRQLLAQPRRGRAQRHLEAQGPSGAWDVRQLERSSGGRGKQCTRVRLSTPALASPHLRLHRGGARVAQHERRHVAPARHHAPARRRRSAVVAARLGPPGRHQGAPGNSGVRSAGPGCSSSEPPWPSRPPPSLEVDDLPLRRHRHVSPHGAQCQARWRHRQALGGERFKAHGDGH